MKCPYCQKETEEKVCPKCHAEIPAPKQDPEMEKKKHAREKHADKGKE